MGGIKEPEFIDIECDRCQKVVRVNDPVQMDFYRKFAERGDKDAMMFASVVLPFVGEGISVDHEWVCPQCLAELSPAAAEVKPATKSSAAGGGKKKNSPTPKTKPAVVAADNGGVVVVAPVVTADPGVVDAAPAGEPAPVSIVDEDLFGKSGA